MISLNKIRDLDVFSGAGTERTYLSAASALVRAGTFLYVVADDELHLGIFRATDDTPGHLIRLFEGELPAPKLERKALKPDLEALLKLPAGEDFPNGALLALGSGSGRNRRRGALLPLDAQGAVHGLPEPVDLSPILAPLEDAFHALNIEGAVVVADEVWLFQRGNRRHRENAIIRFPLSSFLEALRSGPAGALKPPAIGMVDLGEFDGVPFCFTDAAALPDGDMVFTAIAEDTADVYNDGPCAASAIGILDGDGTLRRLAQLESPYKIEGVDALVDGDIIRLLLVTDADDPAIPAALFSGTIEK